MHALDAVATWAIPALLAGIPLWGYLRGVAVYEAFLAGAEEGLRVTVQILPYMLGILVALGVFRASGALDLVAQVALPLTGRLGFPPEVLPLMLIRPLSGSGSLAAVADLLRAHGPDSFVGRLASVMQGSTDTTFYVLSVYFGSVGVKKPRYALWSGLCGDAAGFVAALWACRWFYGGPP
ncbi:spore maturation protein [Caldinitratiruptor microaerophilus]|uniref:Spore maturation protein n=1 Tax=Caldinitratiruptor microaerophilus TaxID=671077 RepID=A0AA35G7D1_9FIRM|nr:spore maturation protein [Caldinitratiruptor microaerophilus]BDG59976.1 spore maturation protein [Caldinitratiruptor microaerophilus]